MCEQCGSLSPGEGERGNVHRTGSVPWFVRQDFHRFHLGLGPHPGHAALSIPVYTPLSLVDLREWSISYSTVCCYTVRSRRKAQTVRLASSEAVTACRRFE